MDIGVITNLISNVGFPIMVTIALFYYINKRDEVQKTERDEWIKALRENTRVIQSLKELIKGLHNVEEV